jgi:hypothetical protein
MTPAGKKDGGEAAEFLNNFCDFLENTEDQVPEEIRAELIAEGIDVDEMIANVQSMVKEKISESKRAWLKEAPAKRFQLLEKLNTIATQQLSVAEIKERVKQLASSGESRELAVAFKNFNQLTDDDLRKLYSDYVKLLNMKKEIDEKKS